MLVALSETSLALVGTLLVTMLNSLASTTLTLLTPSTDAAYSNLAAYQAEVSTTFLSLSPSQGQPLLTQFQTNVSDGAEAAETETESEPRQTAPPWARYVLGLDEVFDQILQESREGPFGDDPPVRQDATPPAESKDPLGRLAPEAATVTPADRRTAEAINRALDALAPPPRRPSATALAQSPESPGFTLASSLFLPSPPRCQPASQSRSGSRCRSYR